ARQEYLGPRAHRHPCEAPLPLPTLTTIKRTCALSSLRRRLSTLSSRRRPGSRLRAHGALVSGSRPTPTAVRGKLIPTFVAPAKAGVQAFARMAHYVFAWIPAYAGTTTYLSQWPTPGRPGYRVSQDPRKRDANLRRSGGGRSPGFTRMARHVFAYRGRGAVSLLPALRTVRAVLPHTALRSVVIYIEIGAQERELAIG